MMVPTQKEQMALKQVLFNSSKLEQQNKEKAKQQLLAVRLQLAKMSAR
jgi:hypothetical protein